MDRPPAREAPTVSEAHGSGADSARANTALRCACAHCPATQDAASAVQVAEPRQTSPISLLRRYVGSFVSSHTWTLHFWGRCSFVLERMPWCPHMVVCTQ